MQVAELVALVVSKLSNAMSERGRQRSLSHEIYLQCLLQGVNIFVLTSCT